MQIGAAEVDPLGLRPHRLAERLDQRAAARFVGAVEEEEADVAGRPQRLLDLGRFAFTGVRAGAPPREA